MMDFKSPLFPAALILLGAAALLVGGRFPYLFFYLALLLFLISYLWLRLSLHLLTGEVELSAGYCEAGQTLTVLYRIRNSPGGRFPYLELTGMIGSAFGTPEGDRLITLQAGESAVYRREVRCTRRGKYDLQTLRAGTGDPFGIFKISRPLAAGREIKVYPRLRPYPEVLLPARQHFGNLPAKSSQCENFNQVADLREWREGDSIKRIHWKQSARHDGLVVKNYEPGAEGSFNIFVDMSRRSYRRDRDHALEDLAVEAAAALIFDGLKKGLLVGVFSEPLSPASLPGRRLGDYRGIMDRMITLSPTGKEGFAGYVRRSSYYLSPGSTLYLLTPRMDTSGATVFLQLKQEGFFPVLAHLSFYSPGGEEAALLKKLKEAGIRVHLLHPAEENRDAG